MCVRGLHVQSPTDEIFNTAPVDSWRIQHLATQIHEIYGGLRCVRQKLLADHLSKLASGWAVRRYRSASTEKKDRFPLRYLLQHPRLLRIHILLQNMQIFDVQNFGNARS